MDQNLVASAASIKSLFVTDVLNVFACPATCWTGIEARVVSIVEVSLIYSLDSEESACMMLGGASKTLTLLDCQ